MIKKHILKSSYLPSSNLAYVIIFLGIVLRLNHYFENRALWLDEAWVAICISVGSLREILDGRAFFSDLAIPPMGLMVFSKIMILLFGNSEYSLRVLPLLAGIASLFLFYRLVKQYLQSERAILIALGLFSCTDSLIYYSAELKQYSSDVLIAIILLMMATNILSDLKDRENILSYGFAGALAVWASYPAVFVLAGTGLTILVLCVMRKQWGLLKSVVVANLVWAASLICLYQHSLRFVNREALLSMWKNSFPPVASYLETLFWFPYVFIPMFEDPLGLCWPVFFATIFILGCISYFNRDKEKCLILLSPFFITLMATAAYKYPFKGRLLLFLLPAAIIFIAEGVNAVIAKFKNFRMVMGFILIAVLFSQPLSKAGYFLFHKREKEDIRKPFKVLQDNFQSGDALLMNNSAQYAYGYYAGHYPFKVRPPFIWKTSDRIFSDRKDPYAILFKESHVYNKEGFIKNSVALGWISFSQNTKINPTDRIRVWLLFSHARPELKKFLLHFMEENGQRLQAVEATGSSVYLYQLGKKEF